MNEVLLFFIVVVSLLGANYYINRVERKSGLYIKITAVVLLLLLIWLTYTGGQLPFRIILTVLAISSLYKELISTKKIIRLPQINESINDNFKLNDDGRKSIRPTARRNQR